MIAGIRIEQDRELRSMMQQTNAWNAKTGKSEVKWIPRKPPQPKSTRASSLQIQDVEVEKLLDIIHKQQHTIKVLEHYLNGLFHRPVSKTSDTLHGAWLERHGFLSDSSSQSLGESPTTQKNEDSSLNMNELFLWLQKHNFVCTGADPATLLSAKAEAVLRISATGAMTGSLGSLTLAITGAISG